MESTQLTLTILAAVAIGALLPLLFQMTLAARDARHMIARVEPRLNVAIEEISSVAAAANRSLAALDAAALQKTAASVVEIGSLAKKAQDVASTIEMASAVGAAAAPVFASLIRAWREPLAESDEAPSNEEAPKQNDRPVSLHRKEMENR